MMDLSARYRLGMWGIALMVVLNVVLMGALWYDRFDDRPIGPPLDWNPNPDEFIERELGLTADQSQQLRALREQNMRDRESLQVRIAALSRSMAEELFSDKPDSARMEAILDSLGAVQTELQRLNFNHFRRFKEICNQEQRDKLKTLVLEAVASRVAPPPPLGAGQGNGPFQRGDRPPPPPDGRRPPSGNPPPSPPGDNH